jgi:PAS domain S-box-containing protein
VGAVTIHAEAEEVVQEAGAKLRRAEVEADAKLRKAEAEADAKVQRAEGPAAAKLRTAEVEADAKVQRAEGPAAAKLRTAEVEADAKVQRAEGPAAAKVQKALIDAALTLHQALVEAASTLREAEVDAAEKLRQAQQELAYQRDVFERFFALSLDMMCISSPAGDFWRVSPSFDALGYSHEELLSRPTLDFVHPDDKAVTLAQRAMLAAGTPTVTFENRFRCKDGSYRWLSWVSGPDSAGTMYSMARDVTEARRMQGELARAKDAADVVNRELESFSYSVAHDLRAPLRSVDGFSQALLEDYAEKLDGEGKKYLSFIRESAQHMAQLIDALLGLSRLSRSPVHREDVDISSLARAANTRVQRSQPKRHVDVVIEDGLRCQGDPRLLAVILDNLFANAWKFTGKREDGRIEFGASSKGGDPVFFMRDNGAGFDMAYSNKLFGVFQRLHSASEFEGTGVGLASVQRVVRRHGGRVWAEGEVDRGATFYFTLDETVDVA